MWSPQHLTDSIMLSGTTVATTARTANLDCLNATHATIHVVISAEVNTSSTNVVGQLLESDDTTASNFATFNSAHNNTIDNTSAAIRTYHVPLVGRKRYLRISLTPDTHTTNGPVIISATGHLLKNTTGATASTASVG